MRLTPTLEQLRVMHSNMHSNMRSNLDELMRDKQDDDWSGWLGFSIEGRPQLPGGGYRYAVVANGYEHVGTYDTIAEASLVKAKLEYRRKAPHHGLIGMDGVA